MEGVFAIKSVPRHGRRGGPSWGDGVWVGEGPPAAVGCLLLGHLAVELLGLGIDAVLELVGRGLGLIVELLLGGVDLLVRLTRPLIRLTLGLVVQLLSLGVHALLKRCRGAAVGRRWLLDRGLLALRPAPGRARRRGWGRLATRRGRLYRRGGCGGRGVAGGSRRRRCAIWGGPLPAVGRAGHWSLGVGDLRRADRAVGGGLADCPGGWWRHHAVAVGRLGWGLATGQRKQQPGGKRR